MGLASVGLANEPARFTPQPDARPLSASVQSGNVLRWRAPAAVRVEEKEEAFQETGAQVTPASKSSVRPVNVQFASHSKTPKAQPSGWNVSRAGTAVRFAKTDPIEDPLGQRQVAFQQEEAVEAFEPPMAPPLAPPAPRPRSSFQPQVPEAAPVEPMPQPEAPPADRNDERSDSDRPNYDNLPAPSVLRRSVPGLAKSVLPGCDEGDGTRRPYTCRHPEGLKCLPNDFLDISPRYADLRRLREELDRGGLSTEGDDILEKVFGDPDEPLPSPSALRNRLRNEPRNWRRPETSSDFRRDRLVLGRIINLNSEQVVVEDDAGGRSALPRRDLHPNDEALLKSLELHQYRSRTGRVVAEGYVGPIRQGRITFVDENDRPVAEVPLNELGSEELNIVARFWQLPGECLVQADFGRQRCWAPSSFAFTASALCHKPLYFEQPQIERYGHSSGPLFQPFISTGKFAIDFLMLPYNMAIYPPNECQYTLGYYRPGSCAPYMIPPVPLSVRGALAEAAVVVGGIWIIP